MISNIFIFMLVMPQKPYQNLAFRVLQVGLWCIVL